MEYKRRNICRGAVQAEKIPFEPDLDNASVGSGKNNISDVGAYSEKGMPLFV
jgi:hypothetical protein